MQKHIRTVWHLRPHQEELQILDAFVACECGHPCRIRREISMVPEEFKLYQEGLDNPGSQRLFVVFRDCPHGPYPEDKPLYGYPGFIVYAGGEEADIETVRIVDLEWA
jgi:hypothetical protein